MSARKQRQPRHPRRARTTRQGTTRLTTGHTTGTITGPTSGTHSGIRSGSHSGTQPGAPRRVSLTLTAILTVLWMLLFASADVLIIGSGVLVAMAVQWVFPLPHVTHAYRIRPLPFARLCAHFLWDVLTSGARMAYIVMWTATPRGGIVDVRLSTTDPIHMTAISALTSLVPGSVVLDLDEVSGIMRLHIFDLPTAGGPHAVTDSVHRVERMLMDALGATRPLHSAPHSRGRR